ncbi:MAG: hypothetical protein A4S12_03380 [Proteobacteria bacterium SG_bin5]|nr:MAG: hypothetical protein A4S12_03380 [Proteobacteria bacterium SG_bin5]
MTDSPKGARDALLDQLHQLFREGGFDGVSIGDVSKLTGLGKSSLYHHFPGGKDDMALAVAERAGQRLRAAVIAPLGEPGDREQRIAAMISGTAIIYAGGEAPCLIAAMTASGTPEPARARLGALLREWIDALAAALVETGAAPDTAPARAFSALARIEGGLMIARALRAPLLFTDELARLEAELRQG